MEQITLRKYHQAMQQLTNALDAAFQKQAELDIANAKIQELTSELSELKSGIAGGADQHVESNGHRETEVKESSGAAVS